MADRSAEPLPDKPLSGAAARVPAAPKPREPLAAASRRKPIRRLIFCAVVLALGGLFAWRYFQTPAEIANSLVLPGNVDVRQVNLAFKVGGRIETLEVDEGDAVKAGQVLATLDKTYFHDDLQLSRAQRDQAAANYEKLKNGSRPEEIEQARAAEASQKASLESASQDYARAQKLQGTGAIAVEEIDRRKAAWLEAQAKLASATESRKLAEIGPRAEDISAGKAAFDAANAQLKIEERRDQDSQLIAPNDGTILTRAREKGAIVSPGEVVFTLTLAAPVWIRSYVDEPDLGSVQPGLKVDVTTDAYAKKVYHGHIGFISPTAEFTPKTVETRELRTDLVYRLRIVVDDPDGGLRQGMPVTTTIALPGTRPRSFAERALAAIGFRSAQHGEGR
ncbi:MAG TPA: secretion protein HlyD [Pirellulales bacterium]|nr:secretion protein HlyD [Pirellulales bacterium]